MYCKKVISFAFNILFHKYQQDAINFRMQFKVIFYNTFIIIHFISIDISCSLLHLFVMTNVSMCQRKTQDE